METTRKRYTGEFKARVALEAIRGDLTLAELAAKHGIHPTMIAAWRRPRDRRHGRGLLGRDRSGQGRGRHRDREAARRNRAAGGGTGFCRRGSRDERRATAADDRAGARAPVDRGAVPAGVDQPRTSDPHSEHRICPYLLHDLEITRPGHVWCADITPAFAGAGSTSRCGAASCTWSRSWTGRAARCSPGGCRTRWTRKFCVEASKEALARFGRPEIFNTDQGSQFTSTGFTDVLRGAEVRISMDGRGRWVDNVVIERLWRSLKYECVYLNGLRAARRSRAVDRLSQRTAAALQPRRQNAGRGVRAVRRNAISGACPG